jgi:hypothetical protein
MKLNITHQESYSRGDLLLRTFFGWLYILLPHFFLLIFVSIWANILTFISWWVILFTGRYPQSFFEFQVGLHRWSTRLNARMFNLVDGYPEFGVNGTDDRTSLEIPYPESLSRGTLLLKTFLGIFYVMIPHGFCLFFVSIWAQILSFISWWVVLFTGKFPASFHEYIVGLLRWSMRVNLYIGLMTDEYPKFSGKE